jgi:hypothetical protein
MTLRDMVSACCGMIFVLLASAQAFGVECATEAQRKIKIETLNERVASGKRLEFGVARSPVT